jgi:hypothetical protein
MEWYTAMYPCGPPGLPDDPVTAYVNNLRATDAAPGSTTTRRARTTRRPDPTRGCDICVASALSSFELEPAPVTPSFKGKTECIDYMCARIKLHTCNDIVNTKNSATRIKSYYMTKVLNKT